MGVGFFTKGGLNLELLEVFHGFSPGIRQNQFELRSYSSWDYTKSVLAIFVGDVVDVFLLAGCFQNVRFSVNIGKWKVVFFSTQEDRLAGKRHIK